MFCMRSYFHVKCVGLICRPDLRASNFTKRWIIYIQYVYYVQSQMKTLMEKGSRSYWQFLWHICCITRIMKGRGNWQACAPAGTPFYPTPLIRLHLHLILHCYWFLDKLHHITCAFTNSFSSTLRWLYRLNFDSSRVYRHDFDSSRGCNKHTPYGS